MSVRRFLSVMPFKRIDTLQIISSRLEFPAALPTLALFFGGDRFALRAQPQHNREFRALGTTRRIAVCEGAAVLASDLLPAPLQL